MRELVIAFGLFLFIEGILYALFPAKMKSMLKKLELVKDSFSINYPEEQYDLFTNNEADDGLLYSTSHLDETQ